jgi:radical SAM superfamily enzyme YgiQ (UPF0313 family)
MRILLVQPYTFTIRGLPQAPLALMYLGGYAEQRGHTVKLLDHNFETDARGVIDEFKPDAVGVTSLTGRMLLDGLAISSYIKRSFPNAKIIWGGVHASVLPENTLEEDPIDFVVIGEGEETFVELLDAIEHGKDYATIKGIGFKRDEKTIINERRPMIKDLDATPLIPWRLINTKRYLRHETLLITSRGCPHRCAFCYNEQFNFRTWRGMSPERVKREIDHALSFHPIRRFRFDDDNFCVNKKRFHGILDVLPLDVPLYFESRVEYLDEEFCRHVAQFKDAFVFLGLESGDDDDLKRMQKDLTVEKIRHGYDLINKYKIKTSGSFVIGAPGQTRKQVEKTLAMIDEIKPTRPSCCIFVPLPGSIFTQQLMREGKLEDMKTMADWATFTNPEYSSAHQYGELTHKEINAIYSRYWWKFVWAFARNGRFGWMYLGFQNVIINYGRLLIKRLRKDL